MVPVSLAGSNRLQVFVVVCCFLPSSLSLLSRSPGRSSMCGEPKHLQATAHLCLIIPASPSHRSRWWLGVSCRWNVKRLSLALPSCKMISSVSCVSFLVLILSSVSVPRFPGSILISRPWTTWVWVLITSMERSEEECVEWRGRRGACVEFPSPFPVAALPLSSPQYLYIATRFVVNKPFAPFSLSALESAQSTVASLYTNN